MSSFLSPRQPFPAVREHASADDDLLFPPLTLEERQTAHCLANREADYESIELIEKRDWTW